MLRWPLVDRTTHRRDPSLNKDTAPRSPHLFAAPSQGRSKTIVGTAIFVLIAAAALFKLSSVNYLVFHAVSETATVGVALTIFAIGWHARRIVRNQLILALAVGHLAIAVIDLLHMLAFKGMGVFAAGASANLATQFWLAARWVEAITFVLGAVLFAGGVRIDPFPVQGVGRNSSRCDGCAQRPPTE